MWYQRAITFFASDGQGRFIGGGGGVRWPGESGRGLLQESSTKRRKERNVQKLYPEYLKCSARTPLFKTS